MLVQVAASLSRRSCHCADEIRCRTDGPEVPTPGPSGRVSGLPPAVNHVTPGLKGMFRRLPDTLFDTRSEVDYAKMYGKQEICLVDVMIEIMEQIELLYAKKESGVRNHFVFSKEKNGVFC